MMKQLGQRHCRLVKEMKTRYMSVNYAAGMCAEPPQRVEQLMVRPSPALCLVWWSEGPAGVSAQS